MIIKILKVKIKTMSAHISDVLLYDKTRHVLENISFEELAETETFKLIVRGMFGNMCSYIFYNNPFRIVCSERINENISSSILKSVEELKTKIKTLPDLMKITRIISRKYTTTTQECRSSKAINKFLDTTQDDYTRVLINVQHDAGYVSNAEIHKHEKYYTVFETSLLHDNPEEIIEPVVEFYKSVKTHKISMGHIKRIMSTICPFTRSLVSVTATKKIVLFDASEYELYRNSQDCPKVKYHEELLEISWNPERLAMCLGEDEYKDILTRWI
ncbi:hypothetical protein BST79_gp279 [Only Syngen Nebraska virus 5]|uniref:hypothetical protein n=1 Tax=Only Syngen Nebraska virus 5 TaxID=1917232 RepID=UPI0009018B27|nr:hypothetical protein BST79_gp279 [Only Syngen Nebraska virus 5]APC25792.1 hypothetical protein [Only Syngen Nebraska virus 5]